MSLPTINPVLAPSAFGGVSVVLGFVEGWSSDAPVHSHKDVAIVAQPDELKGRSMRRYLVES